MTCIDMQKLFPAMAEHHVGVGVGVGSDPIPGPFPAQPVAAVASWPEVDAEAAECVDQRRFRRRVSNRESARRSRARKQRRLDELRGSAALLQRGNRDLAARTEAARGELAIALLANAALRAEAAVLSRRLAAARRALVLLDRLYAGADVASFDGGECCIGSTDVDQMIASSLIA